MNDADKTRREVLQSVLDDHRALHQAHAGIRDALGESIELEIEAGRLEPRRDERTAPVNEAIRRPIFDPTINLGHVLTAAAMLATGFMGYSALERRVSIVEVQQQNAIVQSDKKTVEQGDAIKEIRQDVKDVQRTVNDLSRVITRRQQ